LSVYEAFDDGVSAKCMYSDEPSSVIRKLEVEVEKEIVTPEKWLFLKMIL
jgi:hypothetical protein